jgi:hypothetical protein
MFFFFMFSYLLFILTKNLCTCFDFDGLCSVTLTQKLEPAPYPYVVVPCTFKPEQEAEYSLSLFSKSPEFVDVVTLQPAPDDFIELEMKGEWRGVTAGGCLNQSTWRNNPQFQLKTDKKASMWVSLSVPNKDNKEISIGFYIVKAPSTCLIFCLPQMVI